MFTDIEMDLIPKFQKNMQIDFSFINFHHYDLKTGTIEKYEIPKNNVNKNKYRLFFFTIIGDSLPKIDEKIKNMHNLVTNLFDYFENIYIILQTGKEENIMNIIKKEKINKIIQKEKEKDNNEDNQKIKYIFHILSTYNNKNHQNYINDFFSQQGDEYYFILDKDNKIISINEEMDKFNNEMFLFIHKIKNNNNTFLEHSLEKENKEKERVLLLKQLLNFILKLKKLDYIFIVDFTISFIACVNEEFNSIIIKDINTIRMRGEFRTKEYQYLNNLLNLMKSKANDKLIEMRFEEFPTIDIDIDFTDVKCQKCLKIIPEDKHLYYCYICKQYYCFECVKNQLKNRGKQKYIDQKHNLLFFKARNINNFKNIDKSKLGNNKFADSTDDDQLDTSHSALCNGCRGHFRNMARYVCVTCRPGFYFSDGYIDYCQSCIEEMCVNENEKIIKEEKANDEIYCRENLFTEGHKINNIHKHDEHIYLFLPLEYRLGGHPYKDY